MNNQHAEKLQTLLIDPSQYSNLLEYTYYYLRTKSRKASLEDAKDILQEVTIKLWYKIKEDRIKENKIITSSYVKAVIRNQIRDCFKGKKNKISYYRPEHEDEYSCYGNYHGKSYSELFELLNYYVQEYNILNEAEVIIWEAYRDGLTPSLIEEKFGIQYAAQKRTRILVKIKKLVDEQEKIFTEFKDWFIKTQTSADNTYEIPMEELISV